MVKKLVFPKTVKAKVYRELVGYDPLKDAVFDYDGICEKIALVYGVEKQDIEDNFELSELLPEFLRCVKFVNGEVLKNLQDVPKKKDVR